MSSGFLKIRNAVKKARVERWPLHSLRARASTGVNDGDVGRRKNRSDASTSAIDSQADVANMTGERTTDVRHPCFKCLGMFPVRYPFMELGALVVRVGENAVRVYSITKKRDGSSCLSKKKRSEKSSAEAEQRRSKKRTGQLSYTTFSLYWLPGRKESAAARSGQMGTVTKDGIALPKELVRESPNGGNE
ncbi:unnamed protein product [Toxocara canis]|uniref:Uncharacterized protein n=1 Tax=Toxocara canis TaxID=6265 RepID=A0A183V719_TOXCA|nr:unnamed protein product [Toxocara canis]